MEKKEKRSKLQTNLGQSINDIMVVKKLKNFVSNIKKEINSIREIYTDKSEL